jgi:hypothetical protein
MKQKIYTWINCKRFETEEDSTKFREWDYNWKWSELEKILNITDLVFGNNGILNLKKIQNQIEFDAAIDSVGDQIALPTKYQKISDAKRTDKENIEFSKRIRPYIQFEVDFPKAEPFRFKGSTDKQDWENATNIKKSLGGLTLKSSKSSTSMSPSSNTGLYGDEATIRIQYPYSFTELMGTLKILEAIWTTNNGAGYLNKNGLLPQTIISSFSEIKLPGAKAQSRVLLKITGLKMLFKAWSCKNQDKPCYFVVPFAFPLEKEGKFITREPSDNSIYFDLGEFFYTLYFLPRFSVQNRQAIVTAVVTDGKITSVTINDPGRNYNNTKPPRILISDETGSGAVFAPKISAERGEFTEIEVANEGENYSENVTITIDPPPDSSTELVYQLVQNNDKFIYAPILDNIVDPDPPSPDQSATGLIALFKSGIINFNWVPDFYPYYNNNDIQKLYEEIQNIFSKILEKINYNNEYLKEYLISQCKDISEDEEINICLERIGFAADDFFSELKNKEDLLNEGKIQTSNDLSDTPGISLVCINYSKDETSGLKPENNIDIQYDELIKNNLVINKSLQKTYTSGKP